MPTIPIHHEWFAKGRFNISRACASRTCTKTENKKAVEWYRLCYERLRLSTVKFLCFFIAQVEAVQHFLFGIAIDEGYKGPQANTLAWDVLYPEVKDVKII